MTGIADYFASRELKLPELSAWLDGLDAATRVQAVRRLGRREQERLFASAQGYRPITLDHLVPPALGHGVAVIHHGRNSLPAFSHFEKRFLRVGDELPLVGYNESSAHPWIGPGYFTARQEFAGELLIDYRQPPAARPRPDWPALRSNSAGLSRLVFHQLTDVLRGVSQHVSIGRGYRHGKPLSTWFVLVRE